MISKPITFSFLPTERPVTNSDAHSNHRIRRRDNVRAASHRRIVPLWAIAIFGGLVLWSTKAQEAAPVLAPKTDQGALRKLEKISRDLKAIGLALHNYESVYGSFPPAYLVDANGRPTVSWRVLLLPFLEEAALYNQFDLSKPWDDPVNLPLLEQMPDVFRSPSPGQSSIFTSYAGVSGPNQFFQGGGTLLNSGIRLAEITDGTSNTVGIGVVGRQARIPWTAPGDIDIEAHSALGDPEGFDWPGQLVTPMLFLDAQVRIVPDSTDPDTVLAFSTIAGGEVVTPP